MGGIDLTSIVNVSVRKIFRQTATAPKPNDIDEHHGISNGHGRMNATEGTPLLFENGAHGGHGDEHQPTGYRSFFFNPRHTPGDDSSNPFVKWLAQSWNVFKAVALSCGYSRPPPGANILSKTWSD